LNIFIIPLFYRSSLRAEKIGYKTQHLTLNRPPDTGRRDFPFNVNSSASAA
jgi:hypothetical protein